MEEFLKYIISNIATHESDVKVEKAEDVEAITYLISVNTEDFGKIIGKKGKTIHAIRTLFNLYLHTHDLSSEKKIFVKLVE